MHFEVSFICWINKSLCYGPVGDMDLFHQNYKCIYSLSLGPRGMCTPLRLQQQVGFGCWLLPDNGTEFKLSSYGEYLGAVSCHRKTDSRSSQHQPSSNAPCRLGARYRRTALPIFGIWETSKNIL